MRDRRAPEGKTGDMEMEEGGVEGGEEEVGSGGWEGFWGVVSGGGGAGTINGGSTTLPCIPYGVRAAWRLEKRLSVGGYLLRPLDRRYPLRLGVRRYQVHLKSISFGSGTWMGHEYFLCSYVRSKVPTYRHAFGVSQQKRIASESPERERNPCLLFLSLSHSLSHSLSLSLPLSLHLSLMLQHRQTCPLVH